MLPPKDSLFLVWTDVHYSHEKGEEEGSEKEKRKRERRREKNPTVFRRREDLG